MTTTVTWLSEVLKVDKEFYDPDVAYEFSNGRKFLNTDKTHGGIYAYALITGDDSELLVGDDMGQLIGDNV